MLAAWLAWTPTASADPPYSDQLTPGALRGITYDAGDPWALGYWEYLPSSYDSLGDDELLPLIVFLPGIGEYDDVSECPGGADVCADTDCGNDGLCRALSWGPQSLIRVDQWDDTLRPFIAVSPQNPVPPGSITEWDLDALDTFFQYVVDNYPVDPRRLYLTGMSQGGRGTIQYVAAYPRRFAAAASMPGGIVQAAASCGFADTAFWWFHGEDDNDGHLGPGVFNPCAMVELASMYDNPAAYPQYPACMDAAGQPRPDGRMTMFYGVGHSAWINAIDPIGVGFPGLEWASDQGCGIDIEFREYSAANDSDGVYSWFLSLDRPDVTAPDDLEVPGDGAEVDLTATIVDDDAVAFTWTQTDGDAVTLTNADGATVTLSGLQPESVYTFEVFALDADNQWDRDEVVVTVGEAPPPGTSSGSGEGTGSASDSDDGTASTDPTADGTGTETSATSSPTTTSATSLTGNATVTGGSADATADSGGSESTGEGESEADSTSSCSCSTPTRLQLASAWWLLLPLALRRRRR